MTKDKNDAAKKVPVIGVGASAGGLETLREVFSGYKDQTGMAFVVVQHLDPTHESLMAQLIDRYTNMTVNQAHGGEELEADHVYVIPPGHGLAIRNDKLELTEFVDPRGLRRPIDDFFISLAEQQQENCACVILSGTGADGSRGLRSIMDSGGLCVVQKPDTARYDGMPTSAIATGFADVVAKPEDIIGHLARFFDHNLIDDTKPNPLEDVTDYIDELCELLRDSVGHDFTLYKRPTLVRRVSRRMQILGIDETAEYVRYLTEYPKECEALFRDLLINVTRFFRDRKEFEKISAQIIEPLVAGMKDGEEIRIWIAGCSSGEEPFTFAMLFAEAMRKYEVRPYLQIFATDIDDQMLSIGRSGVYPTASLSDIPEKYRDRYTIAGQGTFTVTPQLRDMVRFSRHSLIKDPPFSKIDIVSCRNLLIYFNEDLQNKVLPLFHFSLREDGHLFLGSSEAIGRFDDLFEIIDLPARLFKRRSVQSRYSLQLTDRSTSNRRRRIVNVEGDIDKVPRTNPMELSALSQVAEHYAPVSMLLDNDGNLMRRWGKAGRYLEFPDRIERSVHIPSLAKPGLREVVGALLREVRETSKRTVARDVEILTEFGKLPCIVIAEPVDDHAILLVVKETAALSVFEDDDLAELDQKEGQLKFLEEELQAARHKLRSTVEELETTNEELKSSNEEMMSMNEELQSTNEELTTVNDELKSKVDQLTVANSDLKNFLGSTELMVLVVDSELKVRSLTDAAAQIFTIGKNIRGSALVNVETSLSSPEYIDIVSTAATTGQQGEYRARTKDGMRQFIARALPYRRMDGSVDGATLVFTDVTLALSLEENLSEERERLRLALEVARIGVWEYEPTSDITRLDDTERQLLDLVESEGGTMAPILSKMTVEDRDRINSALLQAMDGQKDFDEIFKLPLRNGGERWLHGLGRRIDTGGMRKFIGVTYDVTSEQESMAERELMLKEMNHRVKNLFAVISSMVSASVPEAEDVASFATLIRSRISALDRSHSLSTDQNLDAEFTLRELIEAILSETPERTTLIFDGLDVQITRDQLTPLGLIFHEWATNSSKYGALAHESGQVSINWTVVEDKVDLHWLETGSIPSEVKGPGFGTRLISASALQLSGKVEARKLDDGFERTLTFAHVASH